jgi:hypothetical protein
MDIQLCSVCQRQIEPNRATYRCGDMETCSQECNAKRLEHIYIIDPNLSSPVKWITSHAIHERTRSETPNTKEHDACREEACYPETHRPGIFHTYHLSEEKEKPRRDIPSLKFCALATFVPISVILYKLLFSLVI